MHGCFALYRCRPRQVHSPCGWRLSSWFRFFKALALGAKGAGIGRPSLVGMAAYGDQGVDKVVQIFKDEMEMHMRLMGTQTVKDMVPGMVITRNVFDHFTVSPADYLSQQVYSPLPLATKSNL